MVEVRTIYQYVYDIINNESSPTPPKLTEQADLAQSIQSENSSNSTGTISASSVNLNTRDKQTVREDYSESFGSASSVGIKGVQLTMSGGIKVVDQSSILESLESKKQYLENQQISALMEARVREVKAAKIEIEKSKNLLVRAIYMIMRHIALLQTDIQYKLRRDIEWMKKFSSSHNDSFKHLEHIGRLPAVSFVVLALSL